MACQQELGTSWNNDLDKGTLPEVMDRYFEESDHIAEQLLAIIQGLPLLNDSERVQVADLACSLSLEHWFSVRVLLQ